MSRVHSRLVRSVVGALCVLNAAACAGDSTHTADGGAEPSPEERFSFFVTSLKAMRALSGHQSGFGGDLRFGETGKGAGLRGADKICAAVAERSLPGASKREWRAFLSATEGEDGEQVDAIDRIGEGPWYDRVGRLVAASKEDLLFERPRGADSAIVNDLPNEEGIPNLKPDPDQPEVDNHDVLTGSSSEGKLYSATATCKDWTSAVGDPETEGRPRVGHSWDRVGGVGMRPGGGDRPGMPGVMMGPIFFGDGGPPMMIDGGPKFMTGGPCIVTVGGPDGGGVALPPPDAGPIGGPMGCQGGPGGTPSWMSVLDEAGCAAGINLVQTGPPDFDVPTVGSGGGYGAIYCFALAP